MDSEAAQVLYSLLLFAGFIFTIIYLATHSTRKQYTLLRDVVVNMFLICIGLTWIVVFYNLPYSLIKTSSETMVFGIRVLIGAILITLGAFIPNKLHKYFLMILGLLSLLIEIPFVFRNFGSIGALVIVGLALVSVITVPVYLHWRGQNE